MIKLSYTGDLFGYYVDDTGVFNIFPTDNTLSIGSELTKVGVIGSSESDDKNILVGVRGKDDNLSFTYNGQKYAYKPYNLIQNIFSRNTGILESEKLRDKAVVIIGCGSVGSLVALELARAGVGRYLLIDNDIVEYHNVCRHQCNIMDIGKLKVDAIAERILRINPYAHVEKKATTVEQISKDVFDGFCIGSETVFVGCADNRAGDAYTNIISSMYSASFVSIGFWERAFAGEIFYHIPNKNMPCYSCALGNSADNDGSGFSQRSTVNSHLYTTQEDLSQVNFEPGISIDINFVTIIGIKIILDILNLSDEKYKPRLINQLTQYTLVCNTNNVDVGGEMAEIFSYPLQVTTSLVVSFSKGCPTCNT